MNARRIAIIGGGLSGLSAAHRLLELTNAPFTNGEARSQKSCSTSTQTASDLSMGSLEITLFEAGPRLGGIVGTKRIGDYLVDTGADSFITNKPGAIGLCRRLGLEDRLVATDARYRGAHVLYEGRPVPVPDGFQLLSPSSLWPILSTPVLSPWGKLRMLMEPLVPQRSQGVDESLADFVRRRLGREALDRLVQPLVGGIYTSDPEQLSLAATMPRFLDMERESGSLLRATMWPTSSQKSAEPSDSSSSGARYGLFAGFAGGMEDLVTRLRSVVEARCHVRVLSPIQEIRTKGPAGGYQLIRKDLPAESFDAVILATTAYRAASLLRGIDSSLAAELDKIDYASSAIVVTGHQLKDIRHPLNSFGLVVPHRERRRILATSFSSRKFPDRAPPGGVLLRTFVGGAMQPELYDLDDDQIEQLVREELAEIFGVQGPPELSLLVRYPRAMPQYLVGHLDRVSRIEQLVQLHSGLALAGNYLRGVGVPDSIASGESAAASVATPRS